MKSRIGQYVKQTIGPESYNAYVPTALPPEPAINLITIYSALEKATQALTELDSMHKFIPNHSLFLYMYIRKEALLSSQIEGTQSSFTDLILFENDQQPDISVTDVEEVSNYVKAITYGISRLDENFPLSLRLIREIHQILMSGTRGNTKQPGEFRRSQNWIGGTKPSNALFVPPPVEYLTQCLTEFEQFLHDESLPILIKIALVHVQFETIHPFLDGNGRLGRLLITLMLCNSKILDKPILYLSLYLKQHRQVYYNLLQEVRDHGKWETWLEFFLEGVRSSAKQATDTALRINQLFDTDLRKINNIGRGRFSIIQAFEYLQKIPQVTVPLLAVSLNITNPTARTALNKMVSLGIIAEITNKKRDKIYAYQNYLNILEEGTQPLI